MRVMVFVKANEDTEKGVMPTEKDMLEMGNYNEQLIKAGVMLTGEGLHPSSKAARVSWDSSKPVVIDGPFAEAKELVAGFWMWQVKSLDEAIEWAKRMPGTPGTVLEIRPVFEIDDFGASATPEVREQDERLRKMEGQKAKK